MWNFKVFVLLKLCIPNFAIGVCEYVDAETRLTLYINESVIKEHSGVIKTGN
jgi:hypothetical protein